MKKKTLLTILSLILCIIVLAGITLPKKKPILADEMCKAEEFVMYSIEDDSTQEENQIEEQTEDAEDDCDTCISVIGNAKLTLTPDRATITACVEKFNEDINTSKNDNLNIFNSVVTALKNADIKEENITLDCFNVHPSYDYSVGRTPIGFSSRSCFSFEIENLENIATYINILTENGVTDICNICYSVSNIDNHYSTALNMALENAKTKVATLFENDSFKVCGIKEENVYSVSSLCRDYVENISSSLIGKVEIEARVNVIFKKA